MYIRGVEAESDMAVDVEDVDGPRLRHELKFGDCQSARHVRPAHLLNDSGTILYREYSAMTRGVLYALILTP